MAKLKKIRVITALIFFLLLTFLFIDYTNLLPSTFITILVSLQLAPAIAKSISGIGIWTIGLVFVLALTILYGRVYCSTLCPFGVLQDVVIRLSTTKKRRRRFAYKKPYYLVQYLLLAGTLFTIVVGSMVLLNLFEPFSNFGRVINNLIRPIVVLGNNLATSVLAKIGVFWLYPVPQHSFNLLVFVVPVLLLVLILYWSYRYGRLFCNTLCPVGAFLGLISRFSIFKIVIDHSTCLDCGLCEKVCKANCIESNSKKIDFAACISCYNCVEACPTVGLKYSRKPLTQVIAFEPVTVDKKRRDIILRSFTSLVSITAFQDLPSGADSVKVSQQPPRRMDPISPPGSKSIDRYTNLCTACHLCVSACPTQVLYPSVFEYGVQGILQPLMNYNASYCNFDCKICGEVCPSGAISEITLADKHLIQIGKTRLVKEDCIVVTKKKDCGACSEHCPTKAVRMVPYEGKLKIPEVHNEYCIGCGACDHACPTIPRKAIFVESNHIHQQAKPPEKEKMVKPETVEEFPF